MGKIMAKLWKDGGSGVSFRDTKIRGYKVRMLKFRSATGKDAYSLGLAMGRTPSDKAMFDELVYRNKSLYQGYDEEKILKNVRNFIDKHRRTHNSRN